MVVSPRRWHHWNSCWSQNCLMFFRGGECINTGVWRPVSSMLTKLDTLSQPQMSAVACRHAWATHPHIPQATSDPCFWLVLCLVGLSESTSSLPLPQDPGVMNSKCHVPRIIGSTFKYPTIYLRFHICINIWIGNTKGTTWSHCLLLNHDFSLLTQNHITSTRAQIRMNVSHLELPSRWPTFREEPGTLGGRIL